MGYVVAYALGILTAVAVSFAFARIMAWFDRRTFPDNKGTRL